MYLVQNHHDGIVDRKTFDAVQAEMARRSAGKSPSKRMRPPAWHPTPANMLLKTAKVIYSGGTITIDPATKTVTAVDYCYGC